MDIPMAYDRHHTRNNDIYTSTYKVPLGDVSDVKSRGVTQVDEKGHEGNTAVVVTAYLCWRKHGQRNSRTGGFPVYYYSTWTLLLRLKQKNVSCEIEDFVSTHLWKLCGILRSRVLRVSCDLIKDVSPYWGEQNLKAVELSECTTTKYVAIWIRMRPSLYWLDVMLLAVWGGMNDHALLGEHYIICTRAAILLSTVLHEPSDILLTFPSQRNIWRHWRHSRSQISHEPSDIFLTCTWAVGHSFNPVSYTHLTLPTKA